MIIGVIGHNGFIGSHLLALKAKSVKIVPILIKPNWKSFEEFVDCDGIDVIVNAAGSADVRNSFINPENDFEKNVLLVFYLLESIRKSTRKIKLVNFSSAAVYGNPSNLPVLNDSKKAPISPYGYNKMMSEDLLTSYYKNFNIPTVSLRIFSCYGNNNKKQVFWELCKQIKNSSSAQILLQGNKEDTRDFIHINDLLKQLLLVLNCSDFFDGRTVNIANGIEISIDYVAQLIAAKFEIKNIQFTGQVISGYPNRWVADISVFTMLGYKQTISIEQGVNAYCDWFMENAMKK
jgi:UDP-glucose 4-epimerase